MTIHVKLTPCKIDDSCKTECSCKNDNSIVLLYYSKSELSRSFFSFSSKLKAVKHEGLFKNFYYINNLSNLNLNKPFLNAQQLILTYFLYFFQCLNVFNTDCNTFRTPGPWTKFFERFYLSLKSFNTFF